MGITFKEFHELLPYVTKANKPIMIRSRHGVGKSTAVYDYAKSINMPVIERRASQMTEGDLLGLPSLENNCTSWNAPDWLKEACDNPVVLFIDELDRATTEVRQGFFELTDSRKIFANELHKDTLIFAACNGGDAASQYQVADLDPAELDRWTVFDLEPNVEDWLNWASTGINKIVWDFINSNHTHLEHQDDFEANKVYPSRRSWHRLSDALADTDLIVAGVRNPVLYNIANGFVGFEAAAALGDFIYQYKRQVSTSDILDKGKVDLVKDFDINEHTALCEKFKNDNCWTKELSSKQIGNLAAFCKELPSEVLAKMLNDIQTSEKNLDIFTALYPLIHDIAFDLYGKEGSNENK
jgi:MoxR-like ATPase